MQKTAVVTGAASGIGRRTVVRLLAEGWTVWALDLAEDALAKFQSDETKGTYRYHKCDVRDVDSIKAAVRAVRGETDDVGALVCSAGVTIVSSLEENTIEEVDLMLDVNVRGPWLTIREFLPLLRKNASVSDPSRVVILGSIGGLRPKVGTGFYSATKAAVHVLTGIYAAELAASGVIVNAVAPGSVNTPMNANAAKSPKAAASGFKISGVSPLGRIAEAEDIADVVLFYLSDAAKFVNGTVLPVDGGTRAAFVKA